jgi:beta-lactamase regulating signal transducer with metallopeptidase domain
MNMPLWFSNLVFWSAQVLLLVLAAGLLPRLLQIRQPRVLLPYWRALLVVSLALPFIQPWHRLQSIGSISIAPDLGRVSVIPESSPAVAHWHFPSIQIVAQMIGVIILAGIAARFVMLALGLLKLRQFRQASSPISSLAESAAVLEKTRAQVGAGAEFRLSNVDSPVTFGFAAPVILLPERFSSMDAQFQAAIACHELLHVRRHDWAHHLFEEILRAVFWFHPVFAWLIARIRLAREQVVDLEVVRLTRARKTYLEALLEFAVGRTRIAAVPAPPFLAERQLAERVALMLKEVRMSRTRLIASLTVIACCIALAIIFAVSTFPLKAAPLTAQSASATGTAQGVSGGVSGGVSSGTGQGISNGISGGVGGGVSGGISGDARNGPHADEPTVDNSTIWTDTVKRGPMLRQVRGLGKLIRPEGSKNLVARVTLPEFMAKEVQPRQNAMVACAVVLDSMNTQCLVKGHVSSVSSEVVSGIVSLDVSLDSPLPQGVATDLPVDATIDIGKIDNVLYVGRPVHATENSTISLFKLVNDGAGAVRVKVKLGRTAVNTIEVLDGLKEGDKVILSDMSGYDNADRIHIK